MHNLRGIVAADAAHTPGAMKSRERTAPPDSRVEYRWTADHDAGFEKSTFIYDAEGRLIAVDYTTPREARSPQELCPSHCITPR